MPGSGDQAARVEKWAGAPAVRSSLGQDQGLRGGWVRQGTGEDAEGTCVGWGCGEEQDDYFHHLSLTGLTLWFSLEFTL